MRGSTSHFVVVVQGGRYDLQEFVYFYGAKIPLIEKKTVTQPTSARSAKYSSGCAEKSTFWPDQPY